MPRSAPRPIVPLRSRPATRPRTVCVVDPQPVDFLGWEQLAREKDLQLQIVGTAQEALRLSRATAVDLWVLNTQLPGLSGFELCSMLRQRQPTAAIYMVADAYSSQQEQTAWTHRATLFACKGGHLELLEQWRAATAR